MLGVLDRLMATQEEKRLALEWADLAHKRFGDQAAQKIREGLIDGKPVRSARALRLALRRANANLKTKAFIASR